MLNAERLQRRRRRVFTAITVVVGLLSVVPLVAGASRIVSMNAPALVSMADNARLAVAGVGVPIHIVSANVFAILGGLALLWRRRRERHRLLGKIAGVAGMVAAVSGIWLTVVVTPREGTSPLLAVVRLVAASAMGLFIVVGIQAARRRELRRHQVWMARAMAIGFSGATQVLTAGVVFGIFGTNAWLELLGMTAGYVINLAIAEVWLGRPLASPFVRSAWRIAWVKKPLWRSADAYDCSPPRDEFMTTAPPTRVSSSEK